YRITVATGVQVLCLAGTIRTRDRVARNRELPERTHAHGNEAVGQLFGGVRVIVGATTGFGDAFQDSACLSGNVKADDVDARLNTLFAGLFCDFARIRRGCGVAVGHPVYSVLCPS